MTEKQRHKKKYEDRIERKRERIDSNKKEDKVNVE